MGDRLLAARGQDDLLLYDRGFPSYSLFALHQARGVPVCMRVRLKSGEVEVLATSLRDTQRYPAHLFKDLYTKR